MSQFASSLNSAKYNYNLLLYFYNVWRLLPIKSLTNTVKFDSISSKVYPLNSYFFFNSNAILCYLKNRSHVYDRRFIMLLLLNNIIIIVRSRSNNDFNKLRENKMKSTVDRHFLLPSPTTTTTSSSCRLGPLCLLSL